LTTAIEEVVIISKKAIAFITGVEPSRTCRYRLIGSVASEPTKKRVVLKFSKDMRKATIAPPKIEGRRYFNVINQITSNLLAPRLYAASSRVLSNFLRRAEMSNVTIVVIKENCPSITSQIPGLKNLTSHPNVFSKKRPAAVENIRIDIPRITPGITRSEVVKKGDVVVFWADKKEEEATHAAVVTGVDSNGNVIISQKSGVKNSVESGVKLQNEIKYQKTQGASHWSIHRKGTYYTTRVIEDGQFLQIVVKRGIKKKMK